MALTDNLVSYWELEESSGTRFDSHGSNDLTDGNTVLSGTGIQGTCADFESTNTEYLYRSSSGDGLDIANDFSISFWWKPETVAFGYILIRRPTTGTTADDLRVNYRLELAASGTLAFRICTGSSASDITTPTSTFTAGNWHHVVCVKRSSGTGQQIYVNGTSVASGGTTSNASTVAGQFTLGARLRGSYDGYLDGLLDEVGIWDRVLTSDEIAELYNSGSGLSYTDITGGPASTFTPKVMFF